MLVVVYNSINFHTKTKLIKNKDKSQFPVVPYIFGFNIYDASGDSFWDEQFISYKITTTEKVWSETDQGYKSTTTEYFLENC